MTIIPLTYTVCNWNDFASFCNAVKSDSTQGVKAETDFGKIAETLAKLQNKKPDYSFFHMSLGVQCERKLINLLYDLQLFKITTFACGDEVLTIINASLQTWKQGCLENCVKGKPRILKEFFNSVFLLLEKAAADCVNDTHKVMEDDNTFTFKQRF